MSTAQRGNTREIWRRVLPVALVLAAVVTAFVVTHEPLARVEVVDFTQEQQDLGSFYGLWTDEQKALKAMPLTDYIASVTAGKTTVVDTAPWATFAHGVSLSQEGNPPDRTWRRRIGEWGSVYVLQRDLPSPDLVAGLPDGEACYASLSDGTWIKVVAVRLSSSDFTLGSGLHGPHTRSRIRCGACFSRSWSSPCCCMSCCHGRTGVRVSLPMTDGAWCWEIAWDSCSRSCSSRC